MAPPRKSRSSSRGRTSAKSPKSPKSPMKKSPGRPSKSPARTPATATVAASSSKMDFNEGDQVMARWPGTNLYFRANVTFVREDDNEYDVLYEDGTVYTVKAKEVKGNFALKKPEVVRSRSRSRGRSPARKSPGRPNKTTSTPSKKVSSPPIARRSSRSAVRAPKPEPAPMRSSARLANAKIELSSDEEDGPKAIPNPSHPKGKKSMGTLFNLDFSWIQSLFFMVLSPAVLVALHLSCPGKSCKFIQPIFPKTPSDYWKPETFLAVFAFTVLARLLSFIPLGKTVRTASGNSLRLNGFFGVLTLLAIIPGLVYRKVDLKFVTINYFKLMIASFIMSMIFSLVAFVISRWGKRSNINPRGNTGNIVVDFVNGREFNPWFVKIDLKFQTFRMSMMALAMINVLLVIQSIQDNSGKVNPTVVLAAAFQVLYALDKLFFEEYYFFTSDAMNSGYGFSLINSYFSFPFIPTLVTRYIIANNITLLGWQLGAIGLMNALGYIIFRASETQRCEFAKDPNSSSVRHLAYVAGNSGRKILCSGWNGLVRYPNYLGELLMQWSWVLPAAKLAGRADLLIYYLPVFTTLMLIFRVTEANTRNRRKYGPGWDSYCQKVTSNVLPKVY